MISFTRFLLLFSFLAMVLILMGSSCDETPVSLSGTDTKVEHIFNTTNGGTLKTANGAELTIPAGAISNQKDGSPGEVSFTISPNVNALELPVPLPTAYTLVGSIYYFAPPNFIFNGTVQIFLPAVNETSSYGLMIAWYNDEKKEWSLLPVNTVDAENKRIGASVFQLGYFAILRTEKITQTQKGKVEIQADPNYGGIRYIHNLNKSVTLTIIAPLASFGTAGSNGINAPSTVYNPGTYLSGLTIGPYTVIVSKTERGSTPSDLPQEFTYTTPVNVNVGAFTNTTAYDQKDWIGWTDIILPPGGTWVKGTPSEWKAPTIPDTTTNKEPTHLRVGGIRWKHNADVTDFYYTMTVKAVNYKYHDEPWPNLVGKSSTNGNYASEVLKPFTTLGNIPTGTYTLELSCRKRGTSPNPPGIIQTYTVPIIIEVIPFCQIEGKFDEDDFLCWSDFVEAGGTWRVGTPADWSAPTVPGDTSERKISLNFSSVKMKPSEVRLFRATLAADVAGKAVGWSVASGLGWVVPDSPDNPLVGRYKAPEIAGVYKLYAALICCPTQKDSVIVTVGDIPVIEYPSVTIGTQSWMTRNLDVSTYSNGEPIPHVTDTTKWSSLKTGAWCYYNNDTALGSIYGKLYNWYAVNDPRGLAPKGWHVPTDDEWITLTTFLGGSDKAGCKMKETGTSHWIDPNVCATNESSFTGLPGGMANGGGVGGSNSFTNMGDHGYFWSSTIQQYVQRWSLFNGSGYSTSYHYSESAGLSVRCIKDK
jgi:uncharacterized protein (TIGR02145 family)